MALPDAGPQCDHWQALVRIYERFNRRIVEATSVAAKLELGRTGRLLGRAVWAARDPEAVRDSIDRELLMAMPWLAGPPATEHRRLMVHSPIARYPGLTSCRD